MAGDDDVLAGGGVGRRRERRYWDPPFERAHEEWSPREWEEAVLDALRVAVRRRMVSDVPVGILLSGGLDSSLIVALLAEQGQRGLATFSVGFHDVGERVGNEFEYSDLVAQEFGTDHQQFLVDPHRLLPAVDEAITAMAEPMVSHDCVAFYLLSEEVSKSVTVVQSGQGADEVFAGYLRFHAALAAGVLPEWSGQLLSALLSPLPAPPNERHWLSWARRFARHMHLPLLERLTRFELETALIEILPQIEGIELTTWRTDELVLVVADGHPLAAE